jgi:hypothetical protein
MDLQYVMPRLPSHWSWIGDIHSHVTAPAFASHTDQTDESHRPGLHIVVGRLDREPPEFHIEFIVDGTRFPVDDPGLVFAGYRRRQPDSVPACWLDQVIVQYTTAL